MKISIETMGWAPAATMLSVYVLLATGRLNSTARIYQWLNVLPGAGCIFNSGWNGAYPPACTNVMGTTIGLNGVFDHTRSRSAPTAS